MLSLLRLVLLVDALGKLLKLVKVVHVLEVDEVALVDVLSGPFWLGANRLRWLYVHRVGPMEIMLEKSNLLECLGFERRSSAIVERLQICLMAGKLRQIRDYVLF